MKKPRIIMTSARGALDYVMNHFCEPGMTEYPKYFPNQLVFGKVFEALERAGKKGAVAVFAGKDVFGDRGRTGQAGKKHRQRDPESQTQDRKMYEGECVSCVC